MTGGESKYTRSIYLMEFFVMTMYTELMNIGKSLVGFVFLVFGIINLVKPEIYLNFQKRIFKTIYGASFKPSEKTIKINKFFGVFFIILGLMVFLAQ